MFIAALKRLRATLARLLTLPPPKPMTPKEQEARGEMRYW